MRARARGFACCVVTMLSGQLEQLERVHHLFSEQEKLVLLFSTVRSVARGVTAQVSYVGLYGMSTFPAVNPFQLCTAS